MCGIFCAFNLPQIKAKKSVKNALDPKLHELLSNRGPDSNNQIFFNDYDELIEILFAAYVLWHQGDKISTQPLQNENGILIYNGDIFNMNTNNKISDSLWLLSKLNEQENDENLLELFKNIEGPYSFVFYHKKLKQIYFGRDSFGRNSLIIENDDDIIKISSLSYISLSSSKKTIELPSFGIFKFDINTKILTLYPWQNLREEQFSILHELENILQTTLNISESINPDWLISTETNDNYYDFYEIINKLQNYDNIYEELLKNDKILSTVNQLINLLEKSIKKRIKTTQNFCTNCLKEIINGTKDQNFTCNHGKIGILFSGGIDCTIIAALSHKFIDLNEPIDLINVAFENINQQTNKNIDWNVPDRITAKESYEELKNLFPNRVWNLIEVNVNRQELHEKMTNHICHLIYPLNTILDESIGCAFWFASHGIGTVNGNYYESKSRVILVGLGADELFGGYTRHRNSYIRCKNDNYQIKLLSLKKELELDWNRLPSRNLGRDDRIIGDNNKTSRTPFIEENFMKFIYNLKPEQKCCFLLNQGIGDKLLLRLCGYKLGIKKSIQFKKRAIQFGSKIANKKQNANDISEFLKI